MTEPSEGIMSRIMKLLNLANDEEATPAERQLAEENAEKLMAKHMVDRFEAEQRAKKMGNSVRKPIVETWEVNMSAYKAGNDSDYATASEFDHQIIDMMTYVLEHCGIRVNTTWKSAQVKVAVGTASERMIGDPTRRMYEIVGFPEDIAYAERIWFNVFRAFVSNINPQWDLTQSIEYNAYNFASAGMSWKSQVLLAEKAKDTRLEWPWRYQGEDRKQQFYSSYQAGTAIDPGNEPWGRSIHKLKRACKKYCEEHKVEYPYAGGAKLRIASRNSFARSYRQTIKDRLDEIRRKAQEGTDHVDSGKFALAVRDTKERVDEEFYKLFPQFDPEVRRKQQEAMDFERAILFASLTTAEQARLIREAAQEEEMYWRMASRSRRNYRTVREDPSQNYDAAAWARGQKAAHSVNLRNDGEVKSSKRGELES